MNKESKEPLKIYHEKQVKALCALHALNNVLQEKRFTKDDLDEICKELEPGTWMNSHRSIWGIGNYDVNVIIRALEKCGKELVWFDKRKDAEDILNLTSILGFILNIRPEFRYNSWFNITKKHWIAIRQFGEQNYFELDSKRAEGPELIGKDAELFAHFRRQIELPETELFLVLEKSVSDSGCWKRSKTENIGSTKAIEDGLNVIDLNKSDGHD